MNHHTPWPWKVVFGKAALCVARDTILDGGIVADLRNHRSEEESKANARLIAAAPELLAACKVALGAFERNDCIDWSDLERAIAKAEGKE